MGYENGDRRRRSAPRVLALLLAAMGLFSMLPQGAASATPQSKVIVCHATASNTNPWVRIEVSANALPAHLGQVGNSHQHQHSLGRYDFEWTSAYDQDCVRIPVADPILLECSGINEMPDPIQAVADNGDITTIPCPALHAQVALPPSVHQIICARGTAALPYWQSFQLAPGGRWYGVNCVAGDLVDLGVQGGPVQIVCPSEGAISLYQFAPLRPVARVCTPGLVAPTPTNPIGVFTTAIDWIPFLGQKGFMQCPASGSLSLYFLGEGLPVTSSSAMTTYPCTPGAKLDLTRLMLMV